MTDPPAARPRRSAPLRAAAPVVAADVPPAAPAPPATPERARRGLLLVVGVALAVGFATLGIVYAIVAVPVYLLAQSDPSTLDTSLVRTAFFKVALPAGVLFGVLAGGVVGSWLAKGGELPADRTSYLDR